MIDTFFDGSSVRIVTLITDQEGVMSRWNRQGKLTSLLPSIGVASADVIKNNRNKTTLIFIVVIFIAMLSVTTASRAFSAIISSGTEKFNDVVVVHTQPTVEPLDLAGVSHLSEVAPENIDNSTQITVENGEVRAIVNGTPVPLSQNGSTNLNIPNADGTQTNITSTSNVGNTSNSVNVTTHMSSTNGPSQSNNFMSSHSHLYQSGTGATQ